ncbi:MAG: SMP-30/gluconolactonase/LRE family protein [Planctomycetes bacterium]|nr:SMP-30/gluconolactonase/LRE family protein [Planctomycetota bacterium]
MTMRTMGMACLAVGVLLAANARAEDGDPYAELKVKRQQVFEFAEAPAVTRTGDRIEVAFASKGYCDATVAVEDSDGKIIRHLASGVLGNNAPPPFEKNALKQRVVWDGKDDQGKYVDDKDSCRVRVSLGLRASFDKNLYWSPHKRIGPMPIMSAAPEGVYVYDGMGMDHIRLFGHDGAYIRTVHPYPADKVKEVQGLNWADFPEGYRLPTKYGFYQQTLLNCGSNDDIEDKNCRYGWAAMGLAAKGNRIAVAYETLNRISTDGSSGGLPFSGPKVGFQLSHQGYGGYDQGKYLIGPSSLAFSPDAKTLYLTGFLWFSRFDSGCYHALMKMDFEKDDPPQVMCGSIERKEWGSGEKQFNTPTSVAVDAEGRVYVSDFMNDRVQVFAPDGKLVQSIKHPAPAKVLVHQRTGEIYILSWTPNGIPHDVQKATNFDPRKKQATTVSMYSPMPSPQKKYTDPIDLGWGDPGYYFALGALYQVELDSWSAEPALWIVGRKHAVTEGDEHINGGWAASRNDPALWKHNIRVLQKKKGKWETTFSFAEQAEKDAKVLGSNKHHIQYLYFNPVSEKLYVGEPDSGPTCKAFSNALIIDPLSGKIDVQELPFNPMDMAFDLTGAAYLRTQDRVVRFDSKTWREIPWDYGTEYDKVGQDGGMGGRTSPAIAALELPASGTVCYHQSGMGINARGELVVACGNRADVQNEDRRAGANSPFKTARRDIQIYPGYNISPISCSVHVWDRHGQVIHSNAIPGLPQLDGVQIDAQGDLYVLAAPSRVYGGKKYFNDMSESLIKFHPNKGKVLSNEGAIPLPKEGRPDRPMDLYGGKTGGAWVENALWFFGGGGFAGFNPSRAGGGCACWHGRFNLDYFGRSIVPAPFQYNVAVLDSAGNLILRIGRYGNVELSGPAGDDIGFFNGAYVTTHTDRRIFVADHGNMRIVSAKLDYHASQTISLREVKDAE